MARPKVRDDELRGELLAGALQLVEAGGAPAITTRAVAATAGTSMAAVHELFGGKAGLIRALTIEGFARLADALDGLDARPTTDDPEDGILDLAGAFRSFAREHRHLHDVMFAQPFGDVGVDEDELARARDVHHAVMRRMSALLPGAPPTYRKDAALGLTALMQGLNRMELAGILGSGPASTSRRWRTAVLAAARGFVADAP